MRKLDSSQTLALAQKFQEAADGIRQSKQLLENRLKAVGSGWQGEARDKFDQSFEETVARYDQFERTCLKQVRNCGMLLSKSRNVKLKSPEWKSLSEKARRTERKKPGR